MTMVVNFDKQEYLRPAVFGEKADLHSVLTGWDGVKSALACLLADGNNRGGGDLRTDLPIVGSWAGCKVGIVSDTDLVPEKSLPGLEHMPLAGQFEKVGKDISQDILDALKDGDGEYFTPYFLRSDSVLSRVEQRERFENNSEFSKAFYQDSPVQDLAFVWTLFGVRFKISTRAALHNLQDGLNAQRKALGLSDMVQINALHYGQWGVPASQLGIGFKPVQGLQRLTLDLVEQGKARSVVLNASDCPSQIFLALTGKSLWVQSVAPEVDEKAKAFVANLLKGAI